MTPPFQRVRRWLSACLVAGTATTLLSNSGCAPTVQSVETDGAPTQVLDLSAPRIDGSTQELGDYQGQVVLIVNTASKCGYTGQYEDLEALYRKRSDDGFVILGFPSNDFMGQEPGTNEEIAEFCSSRFDVTFPMFAKVGVKGDGASPLFQRLAAAVGEPSWNFNKYLVDREGNVVARFGASVSPTDAQLTEKIDELLG